MDLYLNGRIQTAKTIGEEEQNKIRELFQCGRNGSIVIEGNAIEFEDVFVHYSPDPEMDDLCSLLEQAGNAVDDAYITYYGDWEGGYLYRGHKLQSFDADEFAIRTAPTEMLEAELRERRAAEKAGSAVTGDMA